MQKISILDCTLRDGGYINNWNFGCQTIKRVIKKLTEGNIDIIECGFLEDVTLDIDKSIFPSVESIKPYIEPKQKNTMYVAMIAQPYISIDKISDFDGSSIEGIRLTFHENEIEEAMIYGKQLMQKGYKVFIQPVGTTSYSDLKLLELIDKVNQLNPYAFYLVDTLGIMYKNDLLRMFHLLDNNLKEDILIGFHSHNNLQLSFSNAQELLTLHTKRNLIIDSSVFGMGRGAGNLCTELITQYINENLEKKYDVIPFLEIYDEHLSTINTAANWGYSIPYYLAATAGCHPNYASYLLDKQTITVKSISKILSKIPQVNRDIYNKALIEEQYQIYQRNLIDDQENIFKLTQELLKNRSILLLAPGKTLKDQNEKIINYINQHNPLVFSINFISQDIPIDAVFISNNKRFNDLKSLLEQFGKNHMVVVTSNILIEDENVIRVNYSDLTNDNAEISDNSGLMLLKLMKKIGVLDVNLAGFDGYSEIIEDNYIDAKLNYHNYDIKNDLRNSLIKEEIEHMKKQLNIQFLTKSMYE